MANNKNNESIDEKAYEALENALQINFRDDKSSPRQKAQPDAKGAVNKPRQRSEQAQPRRAPDAAQGQRAPSSAANDASRRNSASIMKSLDGGSLKPALRMATIVSALWVLGGFGLAQMLLSPQIWQVRSLAEFIALPGAGALLIGTLLPLLLIYAFAIMIARAHDLRNAARSMAEVALRLSEPETIGSERIMTVGQAVRREVMAMNEGIERTIARAAELETLVHSEVNALERSYTDNEMRVRGLVQELGSEREAIVNHVERIRSTIAGANEQLKEEMSLATEEITIRLATSGEAFASLIDTRAAMLTEKSDAAAEAIGNLLSSRTETLLQTLNSSGFALTNEFVAPVDRTPANRYPEMVERNPVDISPEQLKFIQDHGSSLLTEKFYTDQMRINAETLLPLIK